MNTQKRTGCIRSFMIVAFVFTTAFFVFYFTIWKVPDNSDKVKPVIQKALGRLERDKGVSPDKNGWTYYEKAIDEVERKGVNLKKDGDRMTPGDLLRVGIKKEDYKLIEDKKEQLKDALNLVEKGYEQDVFYFPVDYSRGLEIEFPDYFRFTRLPGYLTLFGEYAVIHKKYREAARYFLQGIYFGLNMEKRGYFLTGSLGFGGIFYTNSNSLISMLQSGRPDRDTCRYITDELVRMNRYFPSYRDILDADLVYFESTMDWGKRGNLVILYNIATHGEVNEDNAKYIKLLPSGLILEREKRVYENRYLEKVKVLESGSYFTGGGFPVFKGTPLAIIASKMELNPGYFGHGQPVPLADANYRGYLWQRCRMSGMIILAALEWYQKEKGEYPDSLEELVPDYLPMLPEDPYSANRKFIYRKNDKEIYFYSIGEDLKDDGGSKNASRSLKEGDIIFLSPEIINKRNSIKEEK